MPATVINGLFTTNAIQWPNAIGVGAIDGICVLPNTSNTTQTFTGGTLTGANPGAFAIDPSQFPVIVNPGQSAVVHVTFIAPAGANVATAIFSTNTSFSVQIALFGTRTITVTAGMAYPSNITFPITKVGLSSSFNLYEIANLSNSIITVSNITLAIGTDFFLVGAPVVPFTIPIGGVSPTFGVQFSPTGTGFRTDTLQVTTSGPNGTTDSSVVNGSGSQLQSAFNLTGGTQGSLFAFPGAGSPLILLADPTNLSTEEPGSFVKLHDFQIPNIEKQVMRIRGHYEDLGLATILVTAKAKRQGQPDENIQVTIPIGTGAADSWIREFTSEPVPITGELVQLTISRAANSGPVSIIDYMPQFEIKGEVIGGT